MSGPKRRMLIVGASTLLVLAVETWIVRVLLWRVGLSVAIGERLLVTFLSIVPYFVGGVAIWVVVMAISRELRGYVRSIVSRDWAVTSAIVVSINTLVTYFYSILKNSVPILNDRSFDQLLWDLDHRMFFGLSPNVFFLNLFSADWLLQFIDFSYNTLFFITVTLVYPILFGHTRGSLRVAFFSGSALMWSAGAWLYLALPSIGPCYKFFGVWSDVKDLFPRSTYWQYVLIQNYEKVLRIRQGVVDPSVNLVEGVAAFPSLHVALHVFVALWLSRLSRLWGRIAWLIAVIMFIGSVVTGWHYLIDSIAGALLGIAAYAASIAMLRWIDDGDGRIGPADSTEDVY